jgi:hypothetical protein
MRTDFFLLAVRLLTIGLVLPEPATAQSAVVHVAPKQSGDELLRYPDATILVLPGGARATVRQLRKLAEERRLEREGMLTIDAPAAVTVHVTAGDESRSRYTAALSAATTFVSQTAIDNANSVPAAAPCLNGHGNVGLVNGKSSAVGFTPGAPYRITGCGFGSGGIVAIVGDSRFGSFTLTPAKWTDTEIDATLPATLTGVPDQANVTLTVTPHAGPLLQQPGHSFIAVRTTTLIKKLNPSYWTSRNGPYEPAVYGLSGAGVANGSVQFAKLYFKGQCDVRATFADVFSTASMPLAPGFGVESISVINTTSQLIVDNDDAREVVGSPFTVTAAGDGAVTIHYQINSTYRKPPSAMTQRLQRFVQSPLPFFATLPPGESLCSGSYDIAVTVTGPTGMPPLTP